MTFLDFLVKKGVLSSDGKTQIESSLQETGEDVSTLLGKAGVDAHTLLEYKGEYYGVPVRHLDGASVPYEMLKNIPEESARHYHIVPLGVVDGVLEVGIVDPDNIQARDALQFISGKIGMPYKLFLIAESEIESILKNYKNLSGEVSKALSEIDPADAAASAAEDAASGGGGGGGNDAAQESGTHIIEDAPVTKVVSVILQYAAEGNVSDVHIEHTGEKVRVRLRVDGVMYTSLLLPVSVHSGVVARIKILANLKLDEKRKPQDGRFRATVNGRKIDFRVSTFPAYYGEKVVLRILDSGKGIKSMDTMGLSDEQKGMIKEALDAPYGMILITGPTGSGKSTTLYGMLNELDRETQNVISLEDPVEYSIPGVSQSQVRPEIGYTFANGLRSILRQDPDIIMVGEIRDKETAQLAIQAALTGHLVFSTLHTNTAAGVIPRLIDMEVDPYLIAPTLIMAIGQRLIRRVCPESKKMVPMTDSVKMMIDKQLSDLPPARRKLLEIPDHIYEAQPSPQCPSGTKGRMGVYEFLKIDRDLEHIILKNPTEQAVYEQARKNGMFTMKDDALLKSFQGHVPFEEVNNV
jgi:type IV pilus assembly protein PilB